MKENAREIKIKVLEAAKKRLKKEIWKNKIWNYWKQMGSLLRGPSNSQIFLFIFSPIYLKLEYDI